jgi:hypothetical protein
MPISLEPGQSTQLSNCRGNHFVKTNERFFFLDVTQKSFEHPSSPKAQKYGSLGLKLCFV